MKLTYELAWAAATDKATRQMRDAHRRCWNRDDFDTAVNELERLLECYPNMEMDSHRAQSEEQ